jgi:hypothetical protein
MTMIVGGGSIPVLQFPKHLEPTEKEKLPIENEDFDSVAEDGREQMGKGADVDLAFAVVGTRGNIDVPYPGDRNRAWHPKKARPLRPFFDGNAFAVKLS